jgi:hypothetical protein
MAPPQTWRRPGPHEVWGCASECEGQHWGDARCSGSDTTTTRGLSRVRSTKSCAEQATNPMIRQFWEFKVRIQKNTF